MKNIIIIWAILMTQSSAPPELYTADNTLLSAWSSKKQEEEPVVIDLHELEQESMEKVKILIDYKLKQSRKPLAKKKPLAEKIEKPQ